MFHLFLRLDQSISTNEQTSVSESNLQLLLNKRQLWRAGNTSPLTNHDALSSGFDELDTLLPHAGWPRNAVVELLSSDEGVGQLELLMPALSTLSRSRRQWIAWINPPHIPYATALSRADVVLDHLLIVQTKTQEESYWATEQCIQSGACSAVLTWPGKSMPTKVIRRLQVACKAHAVWSVLFRPTEERANQSPAPFRLQLSPESHCFSQDGRWCRELGVEVFKRMGGWGHPKITIRLELEPDMKGLLPVEQYSLTTHTANLSAQVGNSPQLSLGPDTAAPVNESKQTTTDIHTSAFSLRRRASESKATKSSRRRARGAVPSKRLGEASIADRFSFSNTHPSSTSDTSSVPQDVH